MSDLTTPAKGGFMKQAMRTILVGLAVLGLTVSAFGSIHYTVSNLNNVPGGPSAYGLGDLGLFGMPYEEGSGSGQVLINEVPTDLIDLIPTGTGWGLLEALLVDDSSMQIVGVGDYGGTVAPFLLTLAGDADESGTVDGTDLCIWQRHFNTPVGSGNGFWTGDWNGDGLVNGADLSIWRQNYSPLGVGWSLGLTEQSDPVHGPEPASLVLLAISVGLAGPRIRRAFKRG